MANIQPTRFGLHLCVPLLSVVLAWLLVMPLRAEAQQEPPPGFRFHKTRFFVGGHLGMNFPQASSDLFHMVTRELTLEKRDFRAPAVGFDFGVPFHSHFAAVLSYDYARRSEMSESRNFVEENGDPIRQTTRFSQQYLVGTLRFYPIKMEENIGSYAWVPKRVLPYVGGGGGLVHYRFFQHGDFVDTQTLNIFNTSLLSEGNGVTKHVAAGVDLGVTPRFYANVEARYCWAEADLHSDFVGFEPIDLSGLRVVGGVYFRF